MLITNRIVRNSFLLPIHEDYHMLISYIHCKTDNLTMYRICMNLTLTNEAKYAKYDV